MRPMQVKTISLHSGAKKRELGKIERQLEDSLADPIHGFAGAVGGIKKGVENNPFANDGRSLIERYVEGDLSIHFHWRPSDHRPIAVADHSSGRNNCVVIKWPFGTDTFENLPSTDKRRKREVERLKHTGGQMERAVLVEVGQVTQVPKRAFLALPCRERLKLFDQDCGILTDPLQHLEAARIEFRGIQEDRELGPDVSSGRDSRRVDHKLVDAMVECRTEIVDDFTDDDAPVRRTWFFHDHHDVEANSPSWSAEPCFSVELDRRFVHITLKENSHFILERLELLVGPLQFQANASE